MLKPRPLRGRTLRDLEMKSGNALDMLWGASFATGDPQYAKRILDFYAPVADRGTIDVDDLVGVVKAIKSGDMRNVPALRSKYGDEKVVELVFAATALWGLNMNAGPHPFVRKLMHSYVAANPSEPAARGLITLRS